MKKGNDKMVTKAMTCIDEIFQNAYRQNVVGALTTGIGITITSVGIAILTTKPIKEKTNEDLRQDI